MARATISNARALGEHIQEDLGFQVRSWRAQRIGWAVAVVLLVAAVLGLFGRGLLSGGHVASTDGRLSVAFERLARHGAPAQLEVNVSAEAIRDGMVTVWVERDYLDGLELRAIVPEPSTVRDADGRTAYEFEVGDVGADGFDLTFQIEHDDIGPRGGEVSLDGGSAVRIEQLVYP